MAGEEIKWWELNKKAARASEAASEWFKQSIGMRDVMPKPGGSKDIQGAVQAGKQVSSKKNPYGTK